MSELIQLEQRLDKRFRTISLQPIESSGLSWKAKGIHTYLITRPPGWKINRSDLENRSTDGKSALTSGLKELREADYLRIEKLKGDKGQYVGTKWTVVQNPRQWENPEAGNPDSGESGHLISINSSSSKHKTTNKNNSPSSSVKNIFNHLNELREQAWEWKQFTPLKPTKPNCKHISARLTEGKSEAELILILDYLAQRDTGDERSRRYFDNVTPFRVSNCDRYLTMARNWDADGRPLGEEAQRKADADYAEKILEGG